MEVGLPFIKEILHNGKFRSRNGIFRTIKKWNIPYNEKQYTDTQLWPCGQKAIVKK